METCSTGHEQAPSKGDRMTMRDIINKWNETAELMALAHQL